LFTTPDIWNGGSFELTMELGAHDEEKLREARRTLWGHPDLEGCYLDREREPEDQERVDLDSVSLPGLEPLYGFATLPAGPVIPCRSLTIALDDGVDELVLCLPMGALGHAYEVGGYPCGNHASADWVEPVVEWLRGVGETVFARVRYRLGVVGYEVDTVDRDYEDLLRAGIPDQRWIGYLWPEEMMLRWYPPTRTTRFTAEPDGHP